MTVDTQTRELLDLMRAQPQKLYELPLEEARASLKSTFLQFDMAPTEVARRELLAVDVDGYGVPITIYWPEEPNPEAPKGCMLYMHGGGWTLGDMDAMENQCRFVCNQSGCVVVNVDYRLAPEYKFPVGVEDCFAVLQWVAKNAASLCIDANKLAVSGASAGGTLTIVLCVLAKERGGAKIAYQIPVYPAFTLREDHGYASRARLGTGEYGLTEAEISWLRKFYLNSEEDADDYRASPKLYSDFSDFPPALVITAGYDPVLDDGKDYADTLEAAGVEVEYRCFESTIHGFVEIPGAIDAGKEAIDLIATRLKARIA